MHCPSCGAEAQLTQKFCRACGLSLEKVPQLVAELSSSEGILANEASETLQKRQQKIDHLLSITGLGFIALTAISVLTGLIYLMAVGSLPLVPGTVLLIVILGGMVAGSLAVYSENLKKKLSRVNLPKSKVLLERELPVHLEGYQEPFVSVTERTTNLLQKDSRNQKTEG